METQQFLYNAQGANKPGFTVLYIIESNYTVWQQKDKN